MHRILLARRIVCAALLSFITLQSIAHETPAHYELQPISLPGTDPGLCAHISPTYRAPAAALSTLAAWGTITCGPVSCSIPALIGAAYYTYQWWKHCNQTVAEESTPLSHDASHVCVEDAHAAYRSALERAQQIMQQEGEKTYTLYYPLDRKTRTFIKRMGLDRASYRSYTGTPLEHVLHTECVMLLERTAHLDCVLQPSLEEYQAILADVIDAAKTCVHSHELMRGMHVLNWAHSFMSYASALSGGIADGIQETIASVAHPRAFIAQLSRDAHALVCYTMRLFYECGVIETLIDSDNDALLEAYVHDRGAYIRAVGDRMCAYAKHLATPEGVRTAVASATHMALTGKCIHALGKFFSFAARNASSMITRVGDAVVHQPHMLAATADGILVNAANESAQLALRAAEKQLPKAQAMRRLAAYEPLHAEIESLSKAFAQWMRKDYKTLIHLFEGEATKSGRLGGLHHDYLGYLESQGKIRTVKVLPNQM